MCLFSRLAGGILTKQGLEGFDLKPEITVISPAKRRAFGSVHWSSTKTISFRIANHPYPNPGHTPAASATGVPNEKRTTDHAAKKKAAESKKGAPRATRDQNPYFNPGRTPAASSTGASDDKRKAGDPCQTARNPGAGDVHADRDPHKTNPGGGGNKRKRRAFPKHPENGRRGTANTKARAERMGKLVISE